MIRWLVDHVPRQVGRPGYDLALTAALLQCGDVGLTGIDYCEPLDLTVLGLLGDVSAELVEPEQGSSAIA